MCFVCSENEAVHSWGRIVHIWFFLTEAIQDAFVDKLPELLQYQTLYYHDWIIGGDLNFAGPSIGSLDSSQTEPLDILLPT